MLIAAALHFCLQSTTADLCAPREIAPVELTQQRRAALEALADELAHGYDERADTTPSSRPLRPRGRDPANFRDTWEVDPQGDCEDRVLWALRELRARDPALAAAAQMALTVISREGDLTFAHIVLRIETSDGSALYLDPAARGAIRENLRGPVYVPVARLDQHWAAEH